MIKEKVIELKNISKSYKGKNNPINVLTDVNLDFNSGGFYAIMGHSGSGKSTLINILGLIEADYDGTYKLFGEAYSNYVRLNYQFKNEKHWIYFSKFLFKSNIKGL